MSIFWDAGLGALYVTACSDYRWHTNDAVATLEALNTILIEYQKQASGAEKETIGILLTGSGHPG